MRFLRLTYYEAIKTFLKKRTYLGFLILLIVIPLVEVAFKLEGGRFMRMATRNLARDFFFLGNMFNGWIVSYSIMNSMWIHIPLLISFVAGDQLAGEATGGTYRLILTRPTSRTSIFFAKFIVTVLYTILFVVFLAALSIGLAMLLLGSGDLVIVSRGILVLPEADVAWRFIAAYILAIWSMLTISSIALFLSSFVENAIGPIIGTMGIIIVFLVLTGLPVQVLDSVRPYFFTTHLPLWQKMFDDPVNWPAVRESVATLGVYSIVMVLAAWGIFAKKDILS